MFELRDYQKKAHQQIIECFKNKQKTLLVMPTGAGKSLTVISFIDKYKKFYKFVLMVRTRGLVFQLEDDLKKFNLDYEILMNGEKFIGDKKIVLCSKDTMDSRNFLPFEGEENVVLIYDEADEAIDFQKEIIKRYFVNDRVFLIGQTATPYKNMSHYDVYIEPITSDKLREKGVLVDYQYLIPKKIDFNDVGIRNGEFKKADINKKFNHIDSIREMFNSWLNFGDNRQTLIFNTNKQHSKTTVKFINDYYGKEMAIHCDADSTTEQRKEAISKFKRGEIRFLSNVRLFTRGTNIIEIGCIIDQAPTLSVNLHIQKLGRGSRKNPIYKDCIILDVANNVLINNHFYKQREINLNDDYKKTKKDLENETMRVCDNCFKAAEKEDFENDICPFCQFKNKKIKPKKVSEYMRKKIFLETASEEQIEQKNMINDFKKILWKKKNLGKKSYENHMAREKAFFEMFKKYGFDKVLKIRNAIYLDNKTIDKYLRIYGK